MNKILAAALVLASFSLPALAQTTTTTPNYDQNMQNQQQRINNGVASGQLTPGETARLNNRDASINNQIQRDEARDGSTTLTPHQQAVIDRRENRTSAAIYNDKHNDRVDGGTVPAVPAQ